MAKSISQYNITGETQETRKEQEINIINRLYNNFLARNRLSRANTVLKLDSDNYNKVPEYLKGLNRRQRAKRLAKILDIDRKNISEIGVNFTSDEIRNNIKPLINVLIENMNDWIFFELANVFEQKNDGILIEELNRINSRWENVKESDEIRYLEIREKIKTSIGSVTTAEWNFYNEHKGQFNSSWYDTTNDQQWFKEVVRKRKERSR